MSRRITQRTSTRWLLLATLIALLAAPLATWGEADDDGPETVAAAPRHSLSAPAGSEIHGGSLDQAVAAADAAFAAERAAAERAAAERAAAELAAAVATQAAALAAERAPLTAAANDPVAAPPAPAVPPASPSFQTKGEQALALITYPWQQLGYDVVFFGPVQGLRAKILRLERRIEIYVRPGDSVREVAFDIAHELGHAFDFAAMTSAERSEWMAVRGIPSDTLWYGCSACTDYATPAGDWAESFAVWQVGGPSRSEMAPQPTPDQIAVLARIAS